MRHIACISLYLSCILVVTACSPGIDEPQQSGASTMERATKKKDVVVLDSQGIGIEGVLIAAHSAQGELEELYRTGPDGSVKVKVTQGGSVTRYSNWDPMFLDAETVFDVDVGPVRFTDSSYYREVPVPGDITTFEITPVGGAPETALFMAVSRCSWAWWSPPESGFLDNSACREESVDSIFVYAVDGETQAYLSWGRVEEVQTSPGAVVPVVVDVSHTESEPRTLTLTGLPPDEPLWSFGSTDGYNTWDRYARFLPALRTESTSAEGLLSWTSYVPDAGLPGWYAVGFVEYPFGTLAGVDISSGSSAGDVTLSMLGMPLLEVTPLDLSRPEAPTVRWTTGDSVDADVAIVRSTWSFPDGRFVGFSGVVPATRTGEVAMPELPPELAEWAPDSTVVPWTTAAEVAMYRSTLVDSWKDVVADPSRIGGSTEPRVATVLFSISRPARDVNEAPVIEITGPFGTVGGEVSISYTLSDAEADPTDVGIWYSTDGHSYLFLTEGAGSEGTIDLETSPDGTPHVFVWDSEIDLPNYSGPVTIVFQPSNEYGFGSEAWLYLDIDNSCAPGFVRPYPGAACEPF